MLARHQNFWLNRAEFANVRFGLIRSQELPFRIPRHNRRAQVPPDFVTNDRFGRMLPFSNGILNARNVSRSALGTI
jgi:hypothetical protein